MCKRKYPQDWKIHRFQSISSRDNKEVAYELELIEFEFSNKTAPILFIVPGYFQNAFIFDLLPENLISLARYINDHFNFHIFCLHPNGIGNSDYVKKSNLDDIAIDDIGGALKLLKSSYTKRIFALGHSNGSITLQCYFGGLSRQTGKTVFSETVSKDRQIGIDGLLLFAGNVCMTDDDENSQLKKLSKIGKRSRFLLRSLGWINACLLTKFISPTKLFGRLSIAFWKLWSFLYHLENVSPEARKALYNKTLDGTSAATLIQYSKGVLSGCIRTEGDDKYSNALSQIKIPTAQVTFELDPLAVPSTTKRDNFSLIGSEEKKFFVIPNQGHEDFMMVSDFHDIVIDPIKFVIQQT